MTTHADTQLIKRGEQIFTCTVSRSRKGLRITARTHPAVEELIRSWGDGKKFPIEKWGRTWEGPNGPKKMEAWDLTNNPGVLMAEGSPFPFTLDRVGMPILETRSYMATTNTTRVEQGEILNASFLRLTGISNTGIEFFIKGVYSPDLVKRIAEGFKYAVRSLYVNFMKPIDITVGLHVDEGGPSVSSQPWGGNRNGLL